MNTPDDDPAAMARAHRALERMSDETYAIFYASQVERLTYAEIALREQMSLQEVRRHMLIAIRIIARESD